MKKWLLGSIAAVTFVAGPAVAADLPVKAPVYKAPPPVAARTWTGCYFGGHIGGGWGRTSWTDPEPDPGQISTDEGTSDISGFLGGGQIGCNVQTGAWVFGVEGDASWADLSGEHPNPIFIPDIMHTKVKALGTVTGRIGYSLERVLLYAKGGGAWVDNDFAVSAPATGTFATASETRWGWTVGAGLEYGLTSNWSMKLEYGFLDFGTERVRLNCPTCAAGFFNKDIDEHFHTVKVGLNYRLPWWR